MKNWMLLHQVYFKQGKNDGFSGAMEVLPYMKTSNYWYFAYILSIRIP